jgi:xanthine dehydrogenase small subunit
VGPTVIRLSGVERALSQGASIDEASRRLDEDISPIDDLRSTGAYRRDVAANLLRRFWAETG